MGETLRFAHEFRIRTIYLANMPSHWETIRTRTERRRTWRRSVSLNRTRSVLRFEANLIAKIELVRESGVRIEQIGGADGLRRRHLLATDPWRHQR